MLYAGIDIGSATSKAAIIDESGEVLAFRVIPTGSDRKESGREVLSLTCDELGIGESGISMCAATGYGRKIYGADYDFPEIICHAVGTSKIIPGARGIIDIGGQDSKVIELDEQGRLLKFEMNDKCAAGTGRFFEVLADKLLHVDIKELSELMLNAEDECRVSSMCTIFAETEIVSLLSSGAKKESVAAGMGKAVCRRVLGMARAAQIKLEPTVVFSGGAAQNDTLRMYLEELLGCEIASLAEPQLPAAYGAALMCMEKNKCQR